MEYRTAADALRNCELKGSIVPVAEVDRELIKSLLLLAQADQEAAEKIRQGLDQNSILWNNIYALYYDAVHKLVDVFLRFEKIFSLNHLCLFAYLCEKHPELELDWGFFEKLRTKRNGIHYYGQKTTSADWKSIEVQVKLYIKTLQEAIEQKSREK